MLESIRRALTVPAVSVTQILSPTVVLIFLWLMAQDLIPSFAIYLAQIFLMF